MKRANLVGKKFERLRVISFAYIRNGMSYWNCKCKCGKRVVASIGSLTFRKTKSCGCFRKEFRRKHGLSRTLIYGCWRSMIDRCYNPNVKPFKNYGGRGIKICKWIRKSPLSIGMLIGQKPSPNHTIDRTDNDGNYSCGICSECKRKSWPLNIRWATRSQQNFNKRHP